MTDRKVKGKIKKNPTVKEQLKIKDDEIVKLTEEINLSKQRNIKLLAEFDNFQRRTFKEKENMEKYQGYDVIKELLPVIDDLNRAASFNESQQSMIGDNIKSMIDAIEMLDSKMRGVLEKFDIKSFDSINMKFDPNIHEALLEQSSNSVEKGKIIEEFEKGYMYNDKILRHAKVVVSKVKENK